MWQVERGILIGSVRHNDRTSVAHVFTSQHGMVPFIWFLSKTGKNASRNTLPLFLSEFLTYALKGEQNNPALFRFLTESLSWFDHAQEGTYSNFHIAFMIGTASHIGVCPNLDDYTPGCVLDMRDGCFTPLLPKHTEYIPAELSYKLYLLMNSDYDGMKDAPLTGQERVMLLNALNTFFRLHIPSFPLLKSIEVLETVFG